MGYKFKKKNKGCGFTVIEILVILIILCMFVVPLSCCAILPYVTQDTITSKVTDKERVNSKESSKYLIFTEDEVLENSDNLFIWKFDSSDLYRDIKENKTYKFTVYGWRIPFLSWYRNIEKIEEVTEEKKE